MAFPPPVFNLHANIWVAGTTPALNLPSQTNVLCQHYASPHNLNYFRMANPGGGAFFSGIASLLKFPMGTVVFAQGTIVQPDGIPAVYYICLYDQFFYYGFAQAFHGAWVIPCTAAGALKYGYG